MKTAIYYFSSTGNSLVIARNLAKGLDDAELISISRFMKKPLDATYDIVGFVYPVYMMGLPLIVVDFLKTVKISSDAYVFSLATFGGSIGRPHSLAKEILKKRGINLAGGFSVKMPGNYTPLYGAIPKERQDKIFAQQETRIPEILRYVRRGNRGLMEEKPFLLNLALYKLFYKIGTAQIPLSARKGFWSSQACTGCGLCAKVCPVENIQMQDKKPFWLLHCQHCMGCLQWCPVQAIEYKKLTLNKTRYHHPDIRSIDIIG